MSDPRPTPYSQKTRTTCPRCGGETIMTLPANNPGSDLEWFVCAACDHMWSQRRDRTEQGDRPRPDSIDAEGAGS